ncbi:MAG TPA: leishmanolysin-related zinc metalloendopeptidase [Tepidisphaeraceae bacterium]|jgi:hypothetical protein
MIERLDARMLFATLAGTVWTDADGSTTFDAGEKPLKNVVVFIDANVNGRLDADERQKTTDKTGRYSFKNVDPGDVLLGTVGPGGQGQTTPGYLGSAAGGFDIELTGLETLTAEVRRAFAAAAARWESVITGDLPNVGAIDDLQIDITVEDIDGPGGTLAQALPIETRNGSGLPYLGEMEFDESDVADLMAEGHFVDTVTHEMAHVLGFGTIWSDLKLISGEGGTNPQFLGQEATRQYNALFDTRALSVPVESRGGSGTADGHWPERGFVEEMMTGYTEDRGTAEPLSRVTVGSLADLGYKVNLRAADTWDPLNHTSTPTTALDLGARAFERRITLAKGVIVSGVNFGFRTDTAPRVGSFTASDTTLGQSATLRARNITDAEGDDIAGVSFYREANGVSGLQRGRRGDVYVGAASVARRGVWSVSAFTGGLAAGEQAFYAIATDALGLSSRRTTTATLTAPPPPTRPNPVTAVRQSRRTSLLKWRDRSGDEIGFRIELSTSPSYDTILKSFNVPADSKSALLEDLSRGTTYYARVRAYGYGGASVYTRVSGIRV